VTDHTERPIGPAVSRWRHMSPRERAFAFWLTLRRGWQRSIDVTRASTYCTDTDRVMVEFRPGGTMTIASVGALVTFETVLAHIERDFGAEARAQAEQLSTREG
jgi:hypothetical protein